MRIRRRAFLTAAGAAGAASFLPRRVWGANDRVGIACIGLHGIGGMHLGQYLEMDDVNVVALCDVDRNVLNQAAEIVQGNPALETDFRKVLERRDVDAIVAAVPDHWHAPMALQAFEAGKDAYIEKPLGHNIREGRLILEAAKKQGRVLQTGLQQRSEPHWQHAVERIRSGDLGKVHQVRMYTAWNTKEMRGDMGKPSDCPAPEGVDYNLWLGPAPERPYNKARFHEYWYFFWDYSGGMISGWGVHLFDIVMWAMGHDIRSVRTVGGKYVLDDLRDTPDTTETVFECPHYTLSYLVRHGSGWRPFGDMDHGIEFVGTEGTLQVNRRRFQIFSEENRDSRIPSYTESRFDDGRGGVHTGYRRHKRDFLECIRNRERTIADPVVGHIASIPGHLANISYRLNREIKWNSEKELIEGDEEATKLLRRDYREPWVI